MADELTADRLHRYARAMEEVEAAHFRTAFDSGAESNALTVWNALRQRLGMPALRPVDLVRRHRDTLRGDLARIVQSDAWSTRVAKGVMDTMADLDAILHADRPDEALEAYRQRMRGPVGPRDENEMGSPA